MRGFKIVQNEAPIDTYIKKNMNGIINQYGFGW